MAFADLRRDPAVVYAQLADLARQIERPPHRWTPALLWEAYRKLGIAHGNGGRKSVPEQAGVRFTVDQRWFVETIASAVASRLYVTEDTLDDTPFTENSGIDGFVAYFGNDRAAELLDELNRELPA